MALINLFAKNLKAIRESKGMTQQELAELCDMQTNSIGLIETGKRAVSFSTIEIFAQKLDVNYRDLFDFDTEWTIDKNKENLISNLNRQVKELDITTLEHMVDYTKLLKKLLKKKNQS